MIHCIEAWEEIIRASWHKQLQPLDAANVWCDTMLSLTFRPPNCTTHHRLTEWFLIDLNSEYVEHHNQQHRLYQAIRPARGMVDIYWKYKHEWRLMTHSSYAFNIRRERVTGRVLNIV